MRKMTKKAKKGGKKDQTRSRSFMFSMTEEHMPSHIADHKVFNDLVNNTFPKGTQWAFIWHDRDVYTKADTQKNPKHIAGTTKPKHGHLSLYFRSAKTVTAVADLLGLAKDQHSFIQMFTGKGAKQNLFAYLIHRTEGSMGGGKFMYEHKDVVANFDYNSYVDGVTDLIEASNIEKATIQRQIFSGDLRFIDFIMNDTYSTFYLQNKTFVTNAIDTYYKRQMNDRRRDKIKVLYIQGEQGSGKTDYAKHFALKHYRDYCISSSHNDVAQDYLGQDVMIFDDARPGDFLASEWLKLLDPYNNESTINSRYYNKYLAVKCIILTSVTDFEDFFYYAPKKESGNWTEPIGQFMRRFDLVLHAKRREEADILSSDISIYGIEPVPEGYIKQMQDSNNPNDITEIKYVHKVTEKPLKKINHFIARLHQNDSDELLAMF